MGALGINGDVESLNNTVYLVKERFGKIEKDKIIDSVSRYNNEIFVLEQVASNKQYSYDLFDNTNKKFNSDKNLIEKRKYYNGELDQLSIISFDSKGLPIEFNLYSVLYDKNGELKEESAEFAEDENGEYKEILINENGRLEERRFFKYDEEENLIEFNFYDGYGDLKNKSVFKYDSEGNRTEQRYYDENGELEEISILKYDSENNLVEINYYNGVDELIDKWILKYNSEGNRTEEAGYDKDGNLTNRWTLKYTNGKLIEIKRFDEANVYQNHLSYEYHSDKNTIETKFYKSDKKNAEFKAKRLSKYDSKGNWIEAIYFKNGEPEYLVERTFKYY